MNKLKVLFHVNELDRWQTALSNIINFVKDVEQENADIEVVANGPAVSAYTSRCLLEGGNNGQPAASCGKVDGELLNQMKKLSGMGIRFAACRNALRAQSIDESVLPSFVTVVPAGITEIAKKQAEGYAYIKP
ncbi:MAG: hypothetical protein JG764_830 [Clostridiales bacterium]|nr:hypothetical protein [Clostridiales bacterium]